MNAHAAVSAENMNMFRLHLKVQLDDFIDRKHNAWISVYPISIYFRNSMRPLRKNLGDNWEMLSMLDVANVEVLECERGKGYFTAALEEILIIAKERGKSAVLIESVLNDRLAANLESSPGWKRYSVAHDENVNYIYDI